MLHVETEPSALGPIAFAARDGKVVALEFGDEAFLADRLRRRCRGETPVRGDPLGVAGRLRRYFAGELDAVDDLPVELGGTPFQSQVWAVLRTIPAGTTLSYRDVAVRIGQPTAVRAVGLANGSNPVSIVVPCHRVIGADGSLTGYGGGIDRKLWLLEHEGARLRLGLSPAGAAASGRDRGSAPAPRR